jgi:hypothetical protein
MIRKQVSQYRQGGYKIMNPLVDYRIAKIRHEEITAEFDKYWRYHLDEVDRPGKSSPYRLVVGWASVILGTFVIAQTFVG